MQLVFKIFAYFRKLFYEALVTLLFNKFRYMKKLYILFILHLFIFSYCQAYKTLDTADYAKRKDFIKKFGENNDLLITKYKAQFS